MDKKHIVILVAVVVVFTAGGFFGGMKYAQAHAKTTKGNGAMIFTNGSGGMFRRGGNGANGGFTAGQIIGKDDKSITIKMQDGSSKIVFLAGSTQIAKSDQGTTDDLSNGQQVVVTGSTNSDGSITAQNIQIRPNMPQNQTPPQQ